jgi:hypothetical protein
VSGRVHGKPDEGVAIEASVMNGSVTLTVRAHARARIRSRRWAEIGAGPPSAECRGLFVCLFVCLFAVLACARAVGLLHAALGRPRPTSASLQS